VRDRPDFRGRWSVFDLRTCFAKNLSYNPFILSVSAQDECTSVCLCCPFSLWSVSMEHLCTGESHQCYKYVWAYMWVEREHVTPDQLCCSNALTEFRLGEYLTVDQLFCTNALTEFRFRWQYMTPDQLCFNHWYKHTHAL